MPVFLFYVQREPAVLSVNTITQYFHSVDNQCTGVKERVGNGTNYRSMQVFLRTIINVYQLGINEWISS